MSHSLVVLRISQSCIPITTTSSKTFSLPQKETPYRRNSPLSLLPALSNHESILSVVVNLPILGVAYK